MTTTPLNLDKVIGHRGACGHAPENTLISMRKAKELGAKWVEFDVTLTADKQAIVMHDETLDRTTNGKGLVAQTTLVDIVTLDAGSWFKPEFAGEKIPTFIELLHYIAKLGLSINIEIKPTSGQDIETARVVMDTLAKYWQGSPQTILISSFSILSLRTARRLNPHINMGLLLHEWIYDWQETLDGLNAISLNANHNILTPAMVANIKKTGRYVLAYTVNNPLRAKELFAWGVDAVFSDYPDQVLR